MPDAEQLSYQAKPDAGLAHGELTYTFTAAGPPALTTQLVASNAGLSVQQVRATLVGRRTVSDAGGAGTRVEVFVDRAKLEGTAQGEAFQFEFDGPTPPTDLAQNAIRQFCWGLSMTPRRYLLGNKGEYQIADSSQDMQAEAVGIIVDAPVRLPDHAVNVGDSWNSEWSGVGRQGDRGVFRYRQVAKLEDIGSPDSPRGRISFVTTGTLEGASGEHVTEERTVEAKGFILLDISTGVVTALESAGTILINVKSAGLKVTFGYASKYDFAVMPA